MDLTKSQLKEAFRLLSDRDLREAVKLGTMNRDGLKPEALPELDKRLDEMKREQARRKVEW